MAERARGASSEGRHEVVLGGGSTELRVRPFASPNCPCSHPEMRFVPRLPNLAMCPSGLGDLVKSKGFQALPPHPRTAGLEILEV